MIHFLPSQTIDEDESIFYDLKNSNNYFF